MQTSQFWTLIQNPLKQTLKEADIFKKTGLNEVIQQMEILKYWLNVKIIGPWNWTRSTRMFNHTLELVPFTFWVFIFWNIVSFIPDWPQIQHVAKNDLQLLIFLPLPPAGVWLYAQFYVILETEPKTLSMLRKHSTKLSYIPIPNFFWRKGLTEHPLTSNY